MMKVASAMPSSMSSVTPSSATLITQPISRIHASSASMPAAANSSGVRPSTDTSHTVRANRANFSNPCGMIWR